MGVPLIEGYLHTAQGIERLDIHDPINALLLGAFVVEMDKRQQQIPEPPVYEIKPYRPDLDSLRAKIICRKKGIRVPELELDFAFTSPDGTLDLCVAPLDSVKNGSSMNAFTYADFNGKVDFKSFIAVATARTGLLN